jgi:hypothetical protein
MVLRCRTMKINARPRTKITAMPSPSCTYVEGWWYESAGEPSAVITLPGSPALPGLVVPWKPLVDIDGVKVGRLGQGVAGHTQVAVGQGVAISMVVGFSVVVVVMVVGDSVLVDVVIGIFVAMVTGMSALGVVMVRGGPGGPRPPCPGLTQAMLNWYWESGSRLWTRYRK